MNNKPQVINNRMPKRKSRSNTYPIDTFNPFTSNLASNEGFTKNGHELSGFVKREICVIDAHGNKKMAREVQFFNSARKLGSIHIDTSNNRGHRR
ncbi:MAG: hypothetical protein IJR67_00040 [Acholeplasmatales bacterium]|nr:hypothetical protein [Acholeplasmatales bacterium]